jgi:hypothetical protein
VFIYLLYLILFILYSSSLLFSFFLLRFFSPFFLCSFLFSHLVADEVPRVPNNNEYDRQANYPLERYNKVCIFTEFARSKAENMTALDSYPVLMLEDNAKFRDGIVLDS